MPQPHLRTRSRKRLKKASPGGGNRIHYKKEMASTPSCYICGQPLAGTSHLTTAEIRKLNRSKRRIWRLHGGNICHNCLKNALKHAARTI
ncbi:MAG: 50S ribosomal protein L34e [Candidatus Bathyarchaeota archaeon]|nr:50S ribosomal protein L34e [Candidatus Bathyarchaeota archaeon]